MTSIAQVINRSGRAWWVGVGLLLLAMASVSRPAWAASDGPPNPGNVNAGAPLDAEDPPHRLMITDPSPAA